MKYFAIIDGEPDSPDYGVARGLTRDNGEHPSATRDTGEWVGYPETHTGFEWARRSVGLLPGAGGLGHAAIDAWRRGIPAPNVLDELRSR